MNIFQKIAHAFLLHAGSGLGALFRKNYIKKAKNGRRLSEKRLMRILRSSRNTEYGKKYGFADIRTVEDYQKSVPLSTYEDYRAYIDRTVMKGEQKLITGRKITYFATTSGTVSPVKMIPQVSTAYIPLFKFICLVLNALVKAVRARGVSSAVARGFLVTEVSIRPASEQTEGAETKTPVGVISAYLAGGVKLFLPLFTPLPRAAIGSSEIKDMKYVKSRYSLQDPGLKWFGGIFMSSLADIINYIEINHEMLIRDIETGTIDPSVEMTAEMRERLSKKLRPDPERAAELREIFSTPSDIPLISRLWKDMSFVCAIGSGDFSSFTRKVRTLCREDVRFHYGMYAASEASMGTGIQMENSSYLLLSDENFFEFLPTEAGDGPEPARPLTIGELEEGKNYEIVITNRSGFYRYRIRDVVKVTGFEGEVPYIEFAYRANNITDICGSHITGEHVARSIRAVEADLGRAIEDYSLYGDAERDRPRLELFFEAERPVSAEELQRMEQVFEDALREEAWDYDFCRKGEIMDRALLRPVPAGTYRRYRDMRIARGTSENQLKAVRVIDTPEKLDFFRAAVIGGSD